VKNAVGERNAFPVTVRPGKISEIDQLGRRVDAVWLPPRSGIGSKHIPIEPKKVTLPCAHTVHAGTPIAEIVPFHGNEPAVGSFLIGGNGNGNGLQSNVHAFARGRPHHELPISISSSRGPEVRWANGLVVAQRVRELSRNRPSWNRTGASIVRPLLREL